MDFQDRIALVTGAAIGRRRAACGAAVAVDTFGGLDILVNNAGGIPYDTPGFPHVAPDDWTRVLDLNLRAPLLALQFALPALADGGGVVVNLGSTAGIGAAPYHSPEYGAAKAGLMRATACLGELPDVRVNCVAPPPVTLDGLCDAVVLGQ